MYKKHLILGIGIGIFITSIIYFCAFFIYESSIAVPEDIDINEDYIIEMATDMGMIFFDTLQFDNAESQIDENGTLTISPDEYVYISIPKNCTAVEVSDILEKAGLIEDKITFTNYLIDANLTRRLHFGVFLIPKSATDEEIVAILTK